VADDWSSRFFYSEFLFFAKAMHTTPLGTAYAVWTGIGEFRTTVVGIYFFNGPLSFLRGGLTLLVESVVGLKLVYH
jgi:quaternary ammonium compound-resistance protein SugE